MWKPEDKAKVIPLWEESCKFNIRNRPGGACADLPQHSVGVQ